MSSPETTTRPALTNAQLLRTNSMGLSPEDTRRKWFMIRATAQRTCPMCGAHVSQLDCLGGDPEKVDTSWPRPRLVTPQTYTCPSCKGSLVWVDHRTPDGWITSVADARIRARGIDDVALAAVDAKPDDDDFLSPIP